MLEVFNTHNSPVEHTWHTLNDLINAAFTLNGFDDQERNLTFVKTDFQVF